MLLVHHIEIMTIDTIKINKKIRKYSFQKDLISSKVISFIGNHLAGYSVTCKIVLYHVQKYTCENQ